MNMIFNIMLGGIAVWFLHKAWQIFENADPAATTDTDAPAPVKEKYPHKEEKILPPHKITEPEFLNLHLTLFWHRFIYTHHAARSAQAKAYEMAALEILSLFDQEGDCPSVVNKNRGEAETSLSTKSYDLLATVPLWEHSLKVAEYMAEEPSYIPHIYILAGLVHDIAKIPSIYNECYAKGNHVQLAEFTVKTRCPALLALPSYPTIISAIEDHHPQGGQKTDKPLTLALIKCDRKAREDELKSLKKTPV
jgi:hypothetical protein